MKRALAMILSVLLLGAFASCGKETTVPVEEPRQRPLPKTIHAGDVMSTTKAEVESTSDVEEESPDESDWTSFFEYDAKTGTVTISGTEEFRVQGSYDVSPIKHIVIADDVLSADLDAGEYAYAQLESIECSPDCKVSVSLSDISDTPFFRNSANWTDGILYIGSSIAAINKDAPAVCILKSNLSKIGWDLQQSIAQTAPQIERFEIAEENEVYWTDKNGVLYKKSDDGLDIMMYPPASPIETYNVPDSVISLEIPAAKNLKTIHFSAKSSLRSIQYVYAESLSAYSVDAGHPTLYAQDGVLFQKEKNEYGSQPEQTKTVLLDYPRNKSAKEYRIPAGTDKAEYGAFQGCSHLETLYVPASLSDFGHLDGFFSTFNGCEKLVHVYVDAGNKSLSSTKDGMLLLWGTMIYLPGRTEKRFTIPSDVTGFEAYGNDHIETIELGKDVELFSVDACPALKAFRAEGNEHGYYTQNGVLFQKNPDWEDPNTEHTYLKYYPAGKKDKKYTVPDGVTELFGAIEWSSDSAFHDNPYIEEITLPDSVTFIGIGAFAGCTSLKKVNLSDTLKNLGNGAFCDCTSLKEITIPTSLEALGYYDGKDSYALCGSSITDIYYQGTQAQWNKLVNATYFPATLPSGVRVHCTDD